MRNLLEILSDVVSYDAEHDFYAKVFPDTAKGERIRPMKRPDLKAVLEIERQAYEFPWSEGVFRDCMSIGYRCLVYERAGNVVGYGILSVAAGESHIMNICLSPTVQNRGYGRKMMETLMEEARAGGADTMLLEVRPSNERAIRLYEKLGFNVIGTRKNYYPAKGGREDALMLAKTLTLPEE